MTRTSAWTAVSGQQRQRLRSRRTPAVLWLCLLLLVQAPWAWAAEDGVTPAPPLDTSPIEAPLLVAAECEPPGTVTLTSPTEGARVPAPASFNLAATVDGPACTGRTITFFANGIQISGSVWSNVPVGNYSLTARAKDSGGISTSAAVNVSVTGTTVSLTSPSNGTVVTAPASFTLAATASSTEGPIGKVEFYANGVLKNTDTVAPYSYVYAGVAAGSYALTAKAYDTLNNSATSAAVTVTSNAAPSVSLTSPSNGATAYAPANFVLTATASDAGGSISKVEFYSNGIVIATDTASPYTFAYTSRPAGSYALTAKATDNQGAPTTSSTVTVTVIAAPVSANRSYAYNTYQELCKTTEPETGATLMGYDLAGNLAWSAAGLPSTTACDPTGTTAAVVARKVTRGYDTRNRLSTLTFPDANGSQVWTYTPDGLPATVTTNNIIPGSPGVQATNTYSYNRRRLLTSQTLGQTGLSTWTLGYGYDGNASLATHTLPSAEVVSYAPNALGQASKATSTYANYATAVSYYPNGAMQQFTYGNGIVHTLVQNTRQLPDRSKDQYGANAAALDDSYTYDWNGNVAAISDGVTGARGNRTMTYDGLDRLTATASPMFGTATYSYDALDNMTRLTIGGSKARDQYYCYDAKWQLTNVKTGSCTGTSVIGLGYDVQGNLNNKNGVTYTFDYGNRLRQVGSTVESYRYDASGRRILNTNAAGNILSFYGNDGVLRYQSDARRGKLFNYLYLNGSLLATRETPIAGGVSTIKYQHTDALGTPVAISNASGVVIERREYEPYGGQLTPAVTDGPGYTGHVQDAATGLVQMQQRYYDPAIGRFLSVDPVAANSGAGFNRYDYANNNPYRFIDPDGRECVTRDKQTACTFQVTGSHIPLKFTVPTQGFPSRIEGTAANGSHHYDVPVDGGKSNASAANRNALISDPTPGKDQPATPNGTKNNASPPGPLGLVAKYEPSYVNSYVRKDMNGNDMVVNVTLPGHPLFPGIVARPVLEQGGRSVIHNVGEGNGAMQAWGSPYAAPLRNIWSQQTQDAIGGTSP